MTEEVTKPTLLEKVRAHRLTITATAATAGLTAAPVAAEAFDINSTVGPLVDGIAALIPSMTALVLALIPLFIVMAVAKFFPDLFDSILSKLRL